MVCIIKKEPIISRAPYKNPAFFTLNIEIHLSTETFCGYFVLLRTHRHNT